MFRLILLSLLMIQGIYAGPEEDEGVKYANNCEACKVLATELQERLRETGKNPEVLNLGYSVDAPVKQKEYKKSELRFIESLDGLCDRILEYNIHKERTDSTRFAKGMSQTFQTLHGLVDKGVKVELGIPYELWDKPSVEITNMKSQCESLLEEYEDDLREWYEADAVDNRVELIDYLCVQKVLKNKDSSCLREKGDNGKLIEKKEESKKELKDDKEITSKKDKKSLKKDKKKVSKEDIKETTKKSTKKIEKKVSKSESKEKTKKNLKKNSKQDTKKDTKKFKKESEESQDFYDFEKDSKNSKESQDDFYEFEDSKKNTKKTKKSKKDKNPNIRIKTEL